MFILKDSSEEIVIDALESMYPSDLWLVKKGKNLHFKEVSDHVFGFCISGSAELKRTLSKVEYKTQVQQKMYFSMAGEFFLHAEGDVVLFRRKGYRGLAQVGGPVETDGRLCYIDNCKSSILVAPPRMGDPVLNLLTFPANTVQTMHIHPSIRLGVVCSGSGFCHLPKGIKHPLKVGDIFLIGESQQHCFSCGEEGLAVIAYHPDSDVGPTDQNHPMLSRTYLK